MQPDGVGLLTVLEMLCLCFMFMCACVCLCLLLPYTNSSSYLFGYILYTSLVRRPLYTYYVDSCGQQQLMIAVERVEVQMITLILLVLFPGRLPLHFLDCMRDL